MLLSLFNVNLGVKSYAPIKYADYAVEHTKEFVMDARLAVVACMRVVASQTLHRRIANDQASAYPNGMFRRKGETRVGSKEALVDGRVTEIKCTRTTRKGPRPIIQ